MTQDRKARIYLDQNILGYVREGSFQAAKVGDKVDWIYSDEHFREISRGSDRSFLSVLQELNAKRIRLTTPDGANNQA
jgi:hypothetical protein